MIVAMTTRILVDISSDGTPQSPTRVEVEAPPLKKYEEVLIDGEVYVRKTKEWEEYQRSHALRYALMSSGIPAFVSDLTLDDYVDPRHENPNLGRLKKYVAEFESRYRMVHLYIWSHMNGTQKTTTASIVAKSLIQNGFVCRFVLMGDLIRCLSSLEDEEKEENQYRISSWADCDFLVIDDSFDKKKATIYRSQFQISFLDQFLRKRLEIDRKATCFTSNFSIDEIDEAVFGLSLKKLVERSVPDPFEFSVPYTLRNDFDPDELWK